MVRGELSPGARRALEVEANRMAQQAERLQDKEKTPTLDELSTIQSVLDSLKESGIEITDAIKDKVKKDVVGARELSYTKSRGEEEPGYIAQDQSVEKKEQSPKDFFMAQLTAETGSPKRAAEIFSNLSGEDRDYILSLDNAQLELLAPVYAEAAQVEAYSSTEEIQANPAAEEGLRNLGAA